MSNPFSSIAANIRLIAMDFDGVLTDGNIYIDSNGNQTKKFDVKDGMGIKMLQKHGLNIALISGSTNNVINQRANSLNIKLLLKGIENKLTAINQIQNKLDIKSDQTIFLGDDINDLLVLPTVKMFLSPSNAHKSCLRNAHWVGKCKGGEGFVREFSDLFLTALKINTCLPFATSND